MEILSLIGLLKDVPNIIEKIKKSKSKTDGQAKLLLNEVEQNIRFCNLVLNDNVSIDDVIKELSLDHYQNMIKSGYNFEKIQKNRIMVRSEKTRRSIYRWNGKSTTELLRNVYKRIKDIQIEYPYTKNKTTRRWNVRVINLYLRLRLLVNHIENN